MNNSTEMTENQLFKICVDAVKKDGNNLRYVGDFGFCMKAVEKNAEDLKYVEEQTSIKYLDFKYVEEQTSMKYLDLQCSLTKARRYKLRKANARQYKCPFQTIFE